MHAAYDPKVVEPAMLAFWKENKVYEKAVEKNRGKKPFYFLDGPPYTSGTVHIGTAWNKAMKDVVLRYKRMAGFDVWDRAGYDMHGLPTEHKIRDKFNIHLKPEIEKFGIDKFNKACEKYALEMAKQMTADFQRLGVWMDFDNAYMPITKEFTEGEWWLIKRAHEQQRLYEGLRTMPWCAECQTNLAKHELEYKTISDDSIFVKFQVKGKPKEYLMVWTTTPWTIPFNLAVMVNPELDYVKVKVKDEVWIIAKALAGAVVQAIAGIPKVEILAEFTGKNLEGMEYEHPFADIIAEYKEIKAKAAKTHTVVLSSEYVDVSAGTGLVHCAPGCGPEDYEVGYRYGLPAWNTIDERGTFPKEMGEFSGLVARKDDAVFTEALKKRNVLLETTKVEHEYPHCQRCHNAVIFRTTKQWFFKIEDLKPKMIEANKAINWVPRAAFNAFNSWLENLRDNSITKQNFWGTPVPIWKCAGCGAFDVFGSVAEIEAVSRKKVTELHKPWIDEIAYPCACGGVKKRIPDVLDVWVDAGTVSWNCLDYPHRKDLFIKLFPAEFILEGKDQIRGWFNLLMVASMIAFGKPSYRNVYMHGFIQDALGRKMSKSLGNYIEPKEVVDRWGADTFRYYTIGGTPPGVDLNYNPDDASLKSKNLIIFWNLQNYILDLAKELKANPAKMDETVMKALFDLEERHMISKLNSTIKLVTNLMNNYRINEVPGEIEKLLFMLSRDYIQMVREKIAFGKEEDRKVVLFTVYRVFTEGLKLFSIIMPFVTEQVWQNFRKFGLAEESVHLCRWPVANEKDINPELERDMEFVQEAVKAILSAREKAKLNIRWPVKSVEVVTTGAMRKAIEVLEGVIKQLANVKVVHGHESLPEIKEIVKANAAMLGKTFGPKAPEIIAKLSTLSPGEVIPKLEKEGKLVLKTDSESFELVREHVIIERIVPKHFVEMEFRGGRIYLDKTRTAELEAEGFARELMRRIQELRKKAGLEKADRIALYIQADKEFVEMLEDWTEMIEKRCGAACRLGSQDPVKRHQFSSEEKIKAETFKVFFDKR